VLPQATSWRSWRRSAIIGSRWPDMRSPLLVLWSKRDDLEDLYGDPLAIWRAWADDVRGHHIDSGHHMAEEAPEALAASLGDFFIPR
jgi:haloacetate dehalogenase